jgi:hypothetical protein
MDAAMFSSPESCFSQPRIPIRRANAFREAPRDRVATPFTHTSRPGSRPLQLRTAMGPRQHVRSRHPQENMSDHLEVPSPIDEDEAQTPPSAAEAAGSQLSMLSVNDMDIEPAAELPSITVNPARNNSASPNLEAMEAMMDSGGDAGMTVRKQRQRSGAQSNGSVSPVRLGAGDHDMGGTSGKRGFSMGYRADCEKCRMKVPGHYNHFYA